MPGCCVPFCVPEGRKTSFPFPRSHFLSERWRQAIEFGSGTRLVKDFVPLEAEICQQHFKDTDGYSEPVIFHNQESGLVVHLASCRLCLSFDYEEEILTSVSRQMMGNRAIEDILKTTLKIDLNADGDFLQGICEKCIARLDILVALKRRFVDASKAFRRMEIYVKEENYMRQMEARKQIETAINEHKGNTDTTAENSTKSKTNSANTGVLLNDSELTNTSQETIESNTDEDGNDEAADDFQDVEYLLEEEDSPNEEIEDLFEASETNLVRKRKKSGRIPKSSPSKKRPIGRSKAKGSQPPDDVEDSLKEIEPPEEEMEDPENDSPKKSNPPMESQRAKDLTERKCYICLQVFETAKELIFHMAVHVDHDRICKICNEELRNLTTFNRHMAKHDPETRPFKCDHCDLRFTSKDGKLVHMKRCRYKDPQVKRRPYKRLNFPCQHCGKLCSSMHYLIEHEGTHLGIQRHQCAVCSRKFANKQNLDRHAILHTTERPYKCDQCEKSFNHPSKYKDHLRMHSGETPFACGGCGSEFATPSLLRNHKIRYHGAGSDAISHSKLRIGTSALQKIICRFCKVSFVRHRLLVDHIDRFHPDEQVEYYPCHICEQRFTEKKALETHLSIHEKSFACKYCNNRFVSQSGLDKHEPKHNGVKGYLCKTCNNSFSTPLGLRRHEAIHVGIKLHTCDVCGKEFLTAHRLQIHQRIHTGEKPYECHKCRKRFADGSTLYRHLKNVCTD